MKYEDLRQKYMREGLTSAQMNENPFIVFAEWYEVTLNCNIPEPTAMCLATVDASGQPWQRMVLLKYYDEDGFVFFTNYSSRKAGHIEANNRVSLLFPWHALGRQVKVTGLAEKITTAESLKYFVTRPRGSQIGAWASHQSKVITSRSLLDARVEELKQKFHNGEIPIPSFWGGYRVRPDSLEFWQARDNRLHDRFFYKLSTNHDWTRVRLAP